MVTARNQLSKVQREIRHIGKDFTYWRMPLNQFGEEDRSKPPIRLCTCKGIYHEYNQNSTVLLATLETATTRTRRIPMCLCEYDSMIFKGEDGRTDSVKVGDYVFYNSKVMMVAGLCNIMEWNMIIDVSFEGVDDGTDIYIRRWQEPSENQA